MVQMLVHIVSSTVTLPALSLHAKRSPSWFQQTSRHWGHSSRRACTVARPVTDANSSYADLSSQQFCNTQFIPSYAILQPNYFYQFLNPYTDLTSISWSCSMATCLPSRVSAMCQLIWLLTSFTKPGGKEQVLGDLQSNTKHSISSFVWRGMIVHVQAKSFQATVMQYLG